MSKWKSHSVLGLAVLLAVACSKNESESDAATSSSDQTEISDNRSGNRSQHDRRSHRQGERTDF